MSFNQNTFGPISSHGNSDMPNIWTYRTLDIQANVKSAGYFLPKYPILNDGDFIDCDCSDGKFSGTLEFDGTDFTVVDLAFASTGSGLNNTLKINEFSGFPDPLLPSTKYEIGDNILFPDILPATWNDLPANIEFSGTVVASKFTYNGTDTFLKGVDIGLLVVDSVVIDAPNAKVYDIVDVSVNTIVRLPSASIINCLQVGTFDCFAIVANIIDVASADQGIEITGTKPVVISANKVTINSTQADFVGIDLGPSVLSTLEVVDFRSNAPVGAIAIKGLAANGNISLNQKATIASCEFSGGVVALDGINEDDFRYNFDTVTGVRDSNPDAIITMSGNTTATVISASSSDGSNAVLVAGTWLEKDASQYTTTAAGRITADFESPVPSPILITASVEPVSGTNKTIALYACIDGVIQFESGIPVRIDSNNPLPMIVNWQEEMSSTANSYLELFVENRTDTTNILVSTAVSRVR